MKRKIIQILYPIGSFYPSQSGGPNNTIYWITKALKENNVQPTIVSTNDGIESKHNLQLNTWYDKIYGKVIYNKTLIHYLPISTFITTLRQLRKNEIIHLTAIFYPLSWTTAIMNTLFFKKKIVWSPRGELDPQALVYSTWKKKPVLFFVKLFLKNKVTFHSTCDEETQYIKNHFGSDVSIIQIPNYLDLPELLKASKKKYILYLGRIHPKKAIENLIQAIKKSEKFQKENFKLKIVGNHHNKYGEELINLSKQLHLEEKVEFLGHIDGESKERILAEAYCLVMPSHTENFGNVAVEALAQKTPVIASKGTPWKILEDKNAGFWVDNSPESLETSIDKIMSLDLEEYEKLSKSAYDLAISEFDIKNKIVEWINFYQKLTNETK